LAARAPERIECGSYNFLLTPNYPNQNDARHILSSAVSLYRSAVACMAAAFLNDYRNHDWRRDWKPKYRTTERNLRASLAPNGKQHKYIVPGGAWHRHVQEWIIERDLRRAGKHKQLAAFLAKKEAASDAFLATLVSKIKG
jgi:hypothetical protein